MEKLLKIEDIKIQVRKPHRRTITLSDGNVFGISEDVLLSYPIQTGDMISIETIEHIKSEERNIKIKDSALNLLSYRMRSISELRKRLQDKGHDINDINPVINGLIDAGYLNDEQFANAFAQDKVKFNKIGKIVLKRELQKHKINDTIIDTTIDLIYTEYPEEELIHYYLDKRKYNLGETHDLKSRKKMTDYLIRKGFHWDLIYQLLTER